MRLTTKEHQALVQAVTSILGTQGWELYLHGSRVDNNARGGDIDLLLLCLPDHLEIAKKLKRQIILACHDLIGERRIDLTITTIDPLNQSEFATAAVAKAIRL